MSDPSLGGVDISVSQLIAAATHVEWHEAVALVRQAGLLCLETGAALPDNSRIWIQADGNLRVEEVAAVGDFLTSQLAALLGLVLPPSVPQDLQVLSDTNNSDVTSSDPKEFVEALTFFARPDDSLALRALWSRAGEALQAAERATALQSLTERARHAPAKPVVPAVPGRKPLLSRRFALLGAALVAVAIALSGALLLTRRAGNTATDKGSLPAAAQGVAQRVQLSIASATAFVRESIEGVPDVPVGKGADLELPAPRRRPKPRSTETPIALAPPQVKVDEAPVPESVIAGGGIPPARELPSKDGASHALAAAPHGVYSATFPDVIPPALLRAQMPQVPIRGVAMARPGVLELVVSDDGQVRSAKLVPVSNRHLDRMMISAAKAWRFAPATRNGQPVSYRLQMPITW